MEKKKNTMLLIRQVNICKEHVVQASFIDPTNVERLSHIFNNSINKYIKNNKTCKVEYFL